MVKRIHRKANKKRQKYYVVQMLLAVLAMGSFMLACGEQQPLHHVTLASASAQTGCLAQFLQGQPPVLLKSSLQQQTEPLCYQQFALQYSGVSKTPLWVAEYLTPQRLMAKVKREDVFHEETRLKTTYQARLSDYRASGFDRGHMAPSADMGSKTAQAESFSLANMVPQHPKNNQNVWRELEETTRALVSKNHEAAYIVTGPMFEGQQLQRIGRGVLVPSHIFKVVYLPSRGIISAYVSPNNASQQVEVMSVCALEQRLGINLFPQMDESLKRQVFALPRTAKQVKVHLPIPKRAQDQRSQCPNASPTQQQAQRELFAASASTAWLPNVSTTVLPELSTPMLYELKAVLVQGLLNWLWHYLPKSMKGR